MDVEPDSRLPAAESRRPQAEQLPEVVDFEALFRREYPRLVSLAWTLTGSREAAEDAAQDALLALHRRWDELARIHDPVAYVRRTCANLSVSWVRRRVREVRAVTRLGARSVPPAAMDEEAESFWSAVRSLPRRQAQAVALFYGYDLSVEEVAQILDLAPGTVKAHLHRARASLQQRLGDHEPTPEVTP